MKKSSYRLSATFFLLFSFNFIVTGKPLKVAFIGDPQVSNETEMDYARKSIWKELSERKDIDLAIVLGDLANDNPLLLRETKNILDSLPFRCFVVPGNHDRDKYNGHDSFRGLSEWARVFGKTDTSFVLGNARFILMNNVRNAQNGMADYEGGFNEPQKHWLDSLMHIDQKLYIIATHIPLSICKGRDSIISLIPDMSKVLFASGHMHSVARSDIADSNNVLYGEELIAGAVCGSWWRGIKDSDGIPYAIQKCGSPRGYFLADINRRGSYTLRYKGVNMDKDSVLSIRATADSVIYVNVFGGSSDGHVYIRYGTRRFDGELCHEPAPEVIDIINYNSSMSRDYRKEHRDEFIPLRRYPSPHLWKVSTGEGRTSLNSGHALIVIYKDKHMTIRRKFKL